MRYIEKIAGFLIEETTAFIVRALMLLSPFIAAAIIVGR